MANGIPNWLMDPRFVWFVIGLVLFLVEFVAPGLIIFFFGLGAWVVVLVCFVLDINLTLQLLIFLAASIVFLVLLRRRFQSLFKLDDAADRASSHAEDFLGKRVVVTKEIKLDVPGKVEYNGTNWDAVSDVPIEEGAVVEIVGKESIKFKVIPV